MKDIILIVSVSIITTAIYNYIVNNRKDKLDKRIEKLEKELNHED